MSRNRICKVSFAFAALVLAVGFLYVMDTKLMIDEHLHYEQIGRFTAGKLAPSIGITAAPGYHYIMALLAGLTRLDGPNHIRFFSLLFSFSSIVVFFLLSEKLSGERDYIKKYQFVFFPILFPLFFLIYTDVCSLFFVLLALYMCESNKPRLSGLMGVMAMAVRQNNIVWLGFAFLLNNIETLSFGVNRERIRDVAVKSWTFFAGLLIFIVFGILNHGFALGDREAHPSFSFHTGNIFFFLFLFFLLFLPVNLGNYSAIVQLVKRQPLTVLVFTGLFLTLFWTTFRIDHPYNLIGLSFFLRNWLLDLFASSFPMQAVFGATAFYAVLSLVVTPLYRKSYYLMYPLTCLYLSASWLVEPRYYLIPFTLFLVARKTQSRLIESVTLLFFVIVTLYVFSGVLEGRLFL